MASQIEKMARMRRNILLGVIIGTIMTFVWFILPIFKFVDSRFRNVDTSIKGALIVWFLTLMFFCIRYLLYKKKLRKDPSLCSAINDERVKLNWLRAYRFAFYIIVSLSIVWKVYEISQVREILFGIIYLPHLPWLILFAAIISLVGSFLYYNREARDG